MKYEFKIEGANEPTGSIDLHRISLIADCIRKVSEGALQIRIKGISLQKGRKKLSLENALRVSLIGIKEGSTILCLEAKPFSETLDDLQLDLFRQEAQLAIPGQTPVSMFISAFHEALDEDSTKEFIDKPLLKELKKLKAAFYAEGEKFSLVNQGSINELELSKETFSKIKFLDDDLPEPEAILINGRVELLQFSKCKVSIETKDGLISGFISDDLNPEEIAKYWGKEVTLAGTLHYKPNGRNVIEIDRVFEAQAGDEYFSRKKKAETTEQQIQRQLREHNYQNNLSEIIGKWPGDEEFDDLQKMLTP
jgi:hypothetical protein